IADFFLLHRAFAATERLIATWPLATEDQQRLTARISALAPLYQSTLRLPSMSAGVMIEGPLLMHTSVAQINRQLAAALQAEKQLEVALDPTLPAEQPEAAFPRPAGWAAKFPSPRGRPPRRHLALGVRCDSEILGRRNATRGRDLGTFGICAAGLAAGRHRRRTRGGDSEWRGPGTLSAQRRSPPPRGQPRDVVPVRRRCNATQRPRSLACCLARS